MRRFLIAAVVLVAAAAVFGQDEAAEKHIRRVLETRTVTLHFADTSLENVMSFIQDITGLNIVIDPKCDKEKTITARLRDVKLKNALDLMLHPNGFDYLIHKGALFISSKDIIAKMKRTAGASGESELKEGELLFNMKDGSKIKGKVKQEEWTLTTAYGKLTIPAHEIGKITIAPEPEKAKKEGEEKEKDKEAPDEDKVATVRFTVTGKVEMDKLEVDTGRGKLTVTRKDMKEILFPRPYLEKSVEIKPDGKWLDTGIILAKGTPLELKAEGTINDEHKPGGEKFTLMGRIGEKGKEFRVGDAYAAPAGEDGKLYLKVKVPETEEEVTGSYKVKAKAFK
jgi:hypothetical protein